MHLETDLNAPVERGRYFMGDLYFIDSFFNFL